MPIHDVVPSAISAAVAAISFASCGNKAQAPAVEETVEDSIPEVPDSLDSNTVQNDSTANDSVQ